MPAGGECPLDDIARLVVRLLVDRERNVGERAHGRLHEDVDVFHLRNRLPYGRRDAALNAVDGHVTERVVLGMTAGDDGVVDRVVPVRDRVDPGDGRALRSVLTGELAEQIVDAARKIHRALDDDLRIGGHQKVAVFASHELDRLARQTAGNFVFAAVRRELAGTADQCRRRDAEGDRDGHGVARPFPARVDPTQIRQGARVDDAGVAADDQRPVNADVEFTAVAVADDADGPRDERPAVQLEEGGHRQVGEVDPGAGNDVLFARTTCDDDRRDRIRLGALDAGIEIRMAK